MSFAKSVADTANKMKKQVNAKTLSLADELFRTIVSNTPIGLSDTKGQLINNWHVGFGRGKYSTALRTSYQTSGIASLNDAAKLRTSFEFLGKDGEVSFANNVHYAFRAEYAGWPAPTWSGKRGPYAMVRNSLAIVAAKHKGKP